MCCARERFGTGESVEGANLAARTGSLEVVCATTLTCPPEVAEAPLLAGARWRRPPLTPARAAPPPRPLHHALATTPATP